MFVGPSIFSFVFLQLFCQLECIHTLTWEWVYGSFLIHALSTYVCNPQKFNVYFVRFFFYNFLFFLYLIIHILRQITIISFLLSVFFFHISFLHPCKSAGTAIILYNFNIISLLICLNFRRTLTSIYWNLYAVLYTSLLKYDVLLPK